jgi:hypothetical protein
MVELFNHECPHPCQRTTGITHGSDFHASMNDWALLLGLCVSSNSLPYVVLLSLDGLKRVCRVWRCRSTSSPSSNYSYYTPHGCVQEAHGVEKSAIFLFKLEVSDFGFVEYEICVLKCSFCCRRILEVQIKIFK